MKYYASLCFILLTNIVLAQSKEYKLISSTQNSNINYSLFKQFHYLEIYKNNDIKKAFKPVKGKYNVYVFVSEFTGDSFDGTKKLFHDYLILKTKPKKNMILDGFHYTMEWAEPPAVSDLYRIENKNTKIENNINLNSLKLRLNKDYRSEYRDYLNDNGILKLNN